MPVALKACAMRCGLALLLLPLLARGEAWQFDPALLRGAGLSTQTLERFNRAGALLPGRYLLSVYVNQKSIGQLRIRFAEQEGGAVLPCLTHRQWRRSGVDTVNLLQEDAGECLPLAQQLAGSSSQLDMAKLRMDISVPQSLMRRKARGAVDEGDWDAGESLLFANYRGNYWHAQRKDSAQSRENSAFLSLQGGFNLGLWQYRQQGNLSKQPGRRTRWQNLSSYLQRPLAAIGSELSVGELYTSGRFFAGVAHHGLELASDERMLSESQRGYAPVVRGVAQSNARVSIRQNGRELYQTTVAPGPFVIDDLYPTSYNGDLQVTIEEADGTVSRFSVPFAALPQSLRAGHSRYSLALGRTRETAENALFGDFIYQYGLSNSVSLGSGLRLAPGYQALVTDTVYSNSLGAFGLNLSRSRAALPGSAARGGWQAGVNYSRSFAGTHTNLSMAAYRYSSQGYLDLPQALAERAARHGKAADWRDLTRQRSRFEANISQSLGDWGQFFASSVWQNSYRSAQQDRQWQLGYSKAFANGVSLSLSVQRQYSYASTQGRRRQDTFTSLTLSIPLGGSKSSASGGYSYNRRSGAQREAELSGALGETAQYSIAVSHSERERAPAWNGSFNQRLPTGTLGLSLSRGAQHWQAAANAQGALVLHQGGLTLGPWLGDTFALVEAKGATGARVAGNAQSRVDSNGYALVPSLSPYRYNRIYLDPQDAASTVELLEGEQQVVPYAGAAVKLHFHTRSGQALLLHVQAPNHKKLPPGTEAFDQQGHVQGMLGQGNWLYLRSEKQRGQLQLRWGDSRQQRCNLKWNSEKAEKAPLIRLEASCNRV